MLTPEIHYRLERVVRSQLSRPGTLGEWLLRSLLSPPSLLRLPKVTVPHGFYIYVAFEEKHTGRREEEDVDTNTKMCPGGTTTNEEWDAHSRKM